MKKYAISDIHGCLETFKTLLQKIELSRDDELYLLGDYIDRGPYSKGVIDYIWQLQVDGFYIKCLRGNHEQMYLNSFDGTDDWGDYHRETIASFGVKNIEETPGLYIDWMKSLAYYFEVDNYLLVHGGFDFGAADPLQNKEKMLWARDWYALIDKDWLAGRIIVHGHTPMEQNSIKAMADNLEQVPMLDIDNGCVYDYGGFSHLTAFELNEKKLFFEPRSIVDA